MSGGDQASSDGPKTSFAGRGGALIWFLVFFQPGDSDPRKHTKPHKQKSFTRFVLFRGSLFLASPFELAHHQPGHYLDQANHS